MKKNIDILHFKIFLKNLKKEGKVFTNFFFTGQAIENFFRAKNVSVLDYLNYGYFIILKEYENYYIAYYFSITEIAIETLTSLKKPIYLKLKTEDKTCIDFKFINSLGLKYDRQYLKMELEIEKELNLNFKNFICTKANESDFDFIKQNLYDNFDKIYDEIPDDSTIMKEIEKGNFIICSNKERVGFYNFLRIRNEGFMGLINLKFENFLTYILTCKKHRRQGAAEFMIFNFINNNILFSHKFGLRVNILNENAKSLYKKFGFKETKLQFYTFRSI